MQENFMETIFASSNHFISAIKVIRISGLKAREIPRVFNFKQTDPKKFQIRSLKYDGNIIDKAPVIWIPGPNSYTCLLYTSPSPRDVEESRMPSSA